MQRFKDWLQQPFRSDMSAFRWFLFFGMIVVISIFWKLILGGLEEATG